MQAERLVEMANQIADYFRAEPDRQEAITSAARHLRRFWDPRMRKQIIEHYEASGDGLNEIARAAVAQLIASR
jgi:formate dehydrogenase subunit delta